jgi:hypothetical protein
LSKPDITPLTCQEFSDLRGDVHNRMVGARNRHYSARATIAEQAEVLGVKVKDLIPKATRKKRRSREEVDG